MEQKCSQWKLLFSTASSDLFWSYMAFLCFLWQNIDLNGLESSFLAAIDPNSFGLVLINETYNSTYRNMNCYVHATFYLFPGALQKKIKVALQVQKVPLKLLKLTCPQVPLKFSPLVALEPRRRRFHNAVQVALPLSAAKSKDSTRIRLLCSLAACSTPKAVFEDVTDITPITISKGI